MKIIKLLFLMLILISCSKNNKIISIKNQSDIGKVITEEYRNFSNWTFKDFQNRQTFNEQVKSEVNQDVGLTLFEKSFTPYSIYEEMKNGGKRRLINWSKVEFKELKKRRRGQFTGEISGDEYIMFEVVCYEPEGDNTFTFMPFFRYNGEEYKLVVMLFDW